MKITYYSLIIVLLIVNIYSCSRLQEDKDILFQTSTIKALQNGAYYGEITCRELKQYGDFGIGTFNGLDGEIVGLDSKFYHIKADGIGYPALDSMKTPFAVVTFFEPDKSVFIDKNIDYVQLANYLDSLLPTKNIFYAVKVEGVFRYIKARSGAKRSKTYTNVTNVELTKTFEFQDVVGTLVGFRCPRYIEGINVPGYHFHFITKDKKAGGHLLECLLQDAKVEIDFTSKFYMALAESEEFYNMDLTK